MSDEGLKPCPFCGGEATMHKSKFGYGIMCKTPFCCDLTAANKTEMEAIKAWNARQVEPAVHGRWTSTNPPGRSDNIICGVCGYNSIAQFKYCPNCGAKMDEEGEER